MDNYPSKSTPKRISRSLLKLLFLAVFLGIFFWLGGEKVIENKLRPLTGEGPIIEPAEVKFPLPEDPRDVVYTWKYAGKTYSLTETLYGSYYAFYASRPKNYLYAEGALSPNWEEEYFNMFLQTQTKDNTLTSLTAKLKVVGEKNRLTEDQMVELALAFVQAIPYDEIKAQKILAGDQSETPNYPYEVLYKKTGVCSDKSLLAYALMREMGYGAAIFVYETENHMSIGIQCPPSYSNYASGYCYAETTTTGNKIGIIPEIDALNNKAAPVQELARFDENDIVNPSLKNVGEVQIMNLSTGRIYNGIANTLETQRSIDELEDFINQEKPILKSMKAELSKLEKKIKDLKEDMQKLLDAEKFEEYNKLVPEYNDLLSNYQKNAKSYNERINIYNQKISEYNKLIKTFYQT